LVRPGKEPDGRILNVTAVTTRVSLDSLTATTPSGDVLPLPALDAVRHWRYQPVTQEGRAITQRARVRVLFEAPR
jgi:hypothetical protein